MELTLSSHEPVKIHYDFEELLKIKTEIRPENIKDTERVILKRLKYFRLDKNSVFEGKPDDHKSHQENSNNENESKQVKSVHKNIGSLAEQHQNIVTPNKAIPIRKQMERTPPKERKKQPLEMTPEVNQKCTPHKSGAESSPKISHSPPSNNKCETDPHRLKQRNKQIDYGYRTIGYIRYRLTVPKTERQREHPKTPRKNQACSKRSWDGQIKKWRRDLHKWDPQNPYLSELYLSNDILCSIYGDTPEMPYIIEQLKEQIEDLKTGVQRYDEYSDENDNTSSSPFLSSDSESIPDQIVKSPTVRMLVF